MSASTRVFIGLLGGVLVGLLLSQFLPSAVPQVTAIAQPIGKLWLNALQMTIVPLVVSLLIVGINQASDIAESGRVARRAMIWIITLLFLAALGAAIAAPFILSFMPHSAELMQTLQSVSASAVPNLPSAKNDWTTTLIPTNVIASAAAAAIVPLVAFTLLFAFALTQINPERRKQIVSFFQGISDTIIVMVNWILWVGPLGVFALILPLSTQAGGGVIKALGIYILMLCILYLTITALLYAVASVGKGRSVSTSVRRTCCRERGSGLDRLVPPPCPHVVMGLSRSLKAPVGATWLSRTGARCQRFLLVRFPGPLSEPDVQLPPHPALHEPRWVMWP